MKEILYDENTKMPHGYPEVKKLGICSMSGEMTPFVWNGRLMRMELVDPDCGTDNSNGRQAAILDVEKGEYLSYFAPDIYFHAAFVDGGKIYVTGVDMNRRDTIRIYESTDLIHWEDRDLFTNPGWVYYNTGLTKGPDGYVILMESSEPAELLGTRFTHVFATSPDMKTWTFLDPERYSLTKERYTGGPWLGYFDGWYYAFACEWLPMRIFTNSLHRSRDLETWYTSVYNPFLMPSNEDKLISSHAGIVSEENLEKIKTACNINNSDPDLCDWNGNVYINYLCGNQYNFYWMCEAVAENTTVAEFLKSFFE